jgi:hypothetical protein
MLTEAQRVAEFAGFKGDHDAMIDMLRRNYLNLEVTLINTWPKISRGRAAKITGVMISDGEPLFLCMVLRSGSETEYLNGPSWSRSYRPWDEFVINAGEE